MAALPFDSYPVSEVRMNPLSRYHNRNITEVPLTGATVANNNSVVLVRNVALTETGVAREQQGRTLQRERSLNMEKEYLSANDLVVWHGISVTYS